MSGLNSAYRFYPMVFVAMLAAGSVWLEHLTRTPDPPATTDNRTPDFIADAVHITGFAKDGKLRYTLDAPHMTHFPQTDITLVDQPRLQLIAQGRHLRIKADHGEVGPKGEIVDFEGNVEAEREGLPGSPPLHLSSAQLTVWPQEQRAASNVPVQLSQGLTRASGNSMAADNAFGSLKLSGKTRVSFVRNKRNS